MEPKLAGEDFDDLSQSIFPASIGVVCRLWKGYHLSRQPLWSSFTATQQLVRAHTSQKRTSFCTHMSQKAPYILPHLKWMNGYRATAPHTQTHLHTHLHTRQIIPGIASNIWQTGFCLLPHLSSCPFLGPQSCLMDHLQPGMDRAIMQHHHHHAFPPGPPS